MAPGHCETRRREVYQAVLNAEVNRLRTAVSLARPSPSSHYSVARLMFQSNSNMNTSASSQPTARTRVSSAPTSTDGYPSGVTVENRRLERRITDLTDRVDLIDGWKRANSYIAHTDEKIRTDWLDAQEQRIDGLKKRIDGLEKRMERSERETTSRFDRVERFMRGVAKLLDPRSVPGPVMYGIQSGKDQNEAWAQATGEANEAPSTTETTAANGAVETIGKTSGGGSGAASNAGLDWYSDQAMQDSNDNSI